MTRLKRRRKRKIKKTRKNNTTPSNQQSKNNIKSHKHNNHQLSSTTLSTQSPINYPNRLINRNGISSSSTWINWPLPGISSYISERSNGSPTVNNSTSLPSTTVNRPSWSAISPTSPTSWKAASPRSSSKLRSSFQMAAWWLPKEHWQLPYSPDTTRYQL